MPNHCSQHFSFTGSQKDIQQLYCHIVNAEGERPVIDFNRITPMPEALDIENTNQGQKAFISALLKNSPAADEKTKISSLESIFQQQENLCGKVISLDVVKELTVSPKVKNTYIVLNYEQCPLFGYAVTYDGAIGTILSWINVGSDPRQTFPSFIYTDK